MKRPNVLMLYTDQQRWDTLGLVNDAVHTPHLNALAESGVHFTNAFCNNPVCMPSRQSMLSGQYPSVVGCTVNGIEMREDVPCVHTILKPYGYHTANLGKLHFKNHSNRDHREPHPSYGFDTLILSDEPGCYDDAYLKWVEERDPSQVENCRTALPPAALEHRGLPQPSRGAGEGGARHGRTMVDPYVFDGPEHLTHTSFVAEETITYLEKHWSDTFFAIAGFYVPHDPLNPPKRFVEMYDPARLPLPAMNPGEDHRNLSPDEWRTMKAYYYAQVSHLDDRIGMILDALTEAGERDNTIIIFTADHGEHLGDHGLTGKGAPGYDSCSHVPLIVSYPAAIPAGQVRDDLIESVDIAPTILDYCGVQAPPFFQGGSFRPLIEGRDYQPRTSAFLEYRNPFKTSWKTVRTHDFKYCTSARGEDLLFDLKADPHELTNVAADPAHSDALAAMRHELLLRWFDVEKQYPLRTGAY